MPLQRRLPKRGFRNPFRRDYAIVNLEQLEARFADGAVVDPETLHAQGLVRRGLTVKVLGQGDLRKRLTVRAHAFSAGAKTRIAAAGGAVEVIGSA